MRYRKSIKICKGVRVNLSKSGMSLTVGPRGTSVSIGSRGVFANIGVPGTGLYDRVRLDSGSSRKTCYDSETGNKAIPSRTEMAITVEMNDAGDILFKDQCGNLITDESMTRRIKRSAVYKQRIGELREQLLTRINDETESLVYIYRETPTLITDQAVREQLQRLHPRSYEPSEFSIPEPDKKQIEIELTAKANRDIHSIAFWTLKRKRKEYVMQHLEESYYVRFSTWFAEKIAFEQKEAAIKSETDKAYRRECCQERLGLQQLLCGDTDYVNRCIDEVLQKQELPLDFSIQYEYSKDSGSVKLALDLPEIEDIPTRKAVLHPSGRLTIKQKTQKERNLDYVNCVLGLTFFIAGSIFNVSTHICEIQISGYTQRINTKTGNREDQCIFSISFDRDTFSNLNCENIEPIEAFSLFDCHLHVTKSYIMKSVEPL